MKYSSRMKCLKCNKDFQSQGAFNRLCNNCNNRNQRNSESVKIYTNGTLDGRVRKKPIEII